MKKIRCLFSIKWWTKDYCLPIVVVATSLAFFTAGIILYLNFITPKDNYECVFYPLSIAMISIAFGCIVLDLYEKYLTPPKRILLWWTKYYGVRIVSILFSILLFFLCYFGIFIYDKGWHAIGLLSTICAMLGGFIFAFIYYSITNAISKSKTKRSKNADTQKIDKPKYLTVNWWKYNYYFRIVGAIGIFSSVVILSIWCYADNTSVTLSIILGYFAINVVLSIIIGVVVAFVYWAIASVISWVYQKIKGIKSEHISE